MPKQIKKKELTGAEKLGCAFVIAAMGLGLVFTVAFIIFIPSIDSDSESVQQVKSIALGAGYVLFTLAAIASGILCLRAYRRSDQGGDMMRSFFSFLSAFMTLLCVRFMLALFFSGLGETETVKKIVGDNTYSEFIKNQGASFACLVIGLSVMLIAGVTAIIKLAKR
ncbi:MAG: hypothetical protein IKP47_00970 [Ruminococcus sp.]|nr:hypothetical protein [Ruminococcus sp.]